MGVRRGRRRGGAVVVVTSVTALSLVSWAVIERKELRVRYLIARMEEGSEPARRHARSKLLELEEGGGRLLATYHAKSPPDRAFLIATLLYARHELDLLPAPDEASFLLEILLRKVDRRGLRITRNEAEHVLERLWQLGDETRVLLRHRESPLREVRQLLAVVRLGLEDANAAKQRLGVEHRVLEGYALIPCVPLLE